MPSWTLIETHPIQGHTFRRPLDPHELGFALSGRNNGIGDILYHAELHLLNASQDAHLFSETNIIKAWLSTKRRYPLAGATVLQELSESGVPITPCHIEPELAGSKTEFSGDGFPSFASNLHFVVREHDLAVLRPNEIIFGQVACAEEVPQQMATICDGPRPLSDELLAKLYIFRESDSQRWNALHLVILIAHCVVDGTAGRTFMRCLLDTLARGGESDSEPTQVPLKERLEMVIPSAALVPMHLRSLSPARQRWRGAVGVVIAKLRMERDQGGHTLPCRRRRSTARSGVFATKLTQAQTTTVLANCRQYGLTFGNAYLALAQVAMTRVLYRRYLRGEISEEEWAYRKRQPCRMSGPLNLRPYLDKPWYERGGGGEFRFCVSRCFYKLPFMTLGGAEPRQYQEHELLDGAPPFSDLLTFDRFLYRTGLVRKQAKAFSSHPLFFELVHARRLTFGRFALEFAKRAGTANGTGTHGNSDEQDEVLPVTSIPAVLAYDGSTLGNLDLILPTEYPLPSTHPLSPFSSVPHPARAGYVCPPPATEIITTPRIVLEDTTTRLQVYPGQLYLNALTSRGQLGMCCFYDSYVYEEEMVKEWLDEVREAMLWYLGQTHRDQCGHDGDNVS